jgi:serine/threonine protein kinase
MSDWEIITDDSGIIDDLRELDTVIKSGETIENLKREIREGIVITVYRIKLNQKSYIYKKMEFSVISKFKSVKKYKKSIELFKEISKDNTLTGICKLLCCKNIELSIEMIIEDGGEITLHDYKQRDISCALKIACDILKVVIYLKTRKISHGDIKYGNIIITKKNVDSIEIIEAKLIDFDEMYSGEEIGVMSTRICVDEEDDIRMYCYSLLPRKYDDTPYSDIRNKNDFLSIN